MSLRWKIALALAAIAAVATVAVGVIGYRSTRDTLLAEIDRSLADLDLGTLRPGAADLPARGPLSALSAQVVRPDGEVVQTTFPEPIPVTDEDVRIAGTRRDRYATVATDAGDYRVRTIGFPRGAIQVGRSLEETERVLGSLRGRTILLVIVVSGAAVLAGLWIAGRVTASLRRLTGAAEHVEATGRLDVAVNEQRDDEVGRLAVAFDRMLAALHRSQDEQHRLVQDAGHELRTPLTSIRTNLDTLRRYPDLDSGDRDAIVDDLHAETAELTDLVDEIVTVASGATADEPREPFDLAAVVGDLATRYQRRTGRTIVLDARPAPVVGQRTSIQRAVSCLLDNARKFDGSGGPIEVMVRPGTVTVADRGPGIPDDDLALVFDRFHRAADARPLPGSGLGLAIVRDVARRHGGDAFAANRPGGGAEVGFRIAVDELPPPLPPTAGT